MTAKQTCHLGRALEEPFSVSLQAQTGLIQTAALPHTGQHILKGAARGVMIEHAIGGNQGRSRPLGYARQPVQPRAVIALAQGSRSQIDLIGPSPLPHRHLGLKGPRCLGRQIQRRGNQSDQALAEGYGLFKGQAAIALGNPVLIGVKILILRPLMDVPHLAKRQEAAKAAIGGAVAGIDDQFRPLQEHQTTADQQPKALSLGRHMGPHHPGQTVSIRQSDCRQTQSLGRQHQLISMGRPLEKREVAAQVQLGIGQISAHGTGSCKDPVQPPFGRPVLILAAIEAFAKQPVAAPGLVLDTVIVARAGWTR